MIHHSVYASCDKRSPDVSQKATGTEQNTRVFFVRNVVYGYGIGGTKFNDSSTVSGGPEMELVLMNNLYLAIQERTGPAIAFDYEPKDDNVKIYLRDNVLNSAGSNLNPSDWDILLDTGKIDIQQRDLQKSKYEVTDANRIAGYSATLSIINLPRIVEPLDDPGNRIRNPIVKLAGVRVPSTTCHDDRIRNGINNWSLRILENDTNSKAPKAPTCNP